MITWRRFFAHGSNVLGLVIVAFFAAVTLFAPLIAPSVPQPAGGDYQAAYIKKVAGQVTKTPQPPSAKAWLGTTSDRVDVFYWLLWGARPSLAFSLQVGLFAAAIGVLVGTWSGYIGGRLGAAAMRLTDGFLTFPVIAGYLVLAQMRSIALMRLPDNGYIENAAGVRVLSDTATRLQAADPLFWALIFLTWMPYACMLYATVSVQRSSEYVQAAVAMGAGMGRILFRHILPNSIAPAIVLLARDIGAVVILQASFAFAGFGGASPWGQLLLAGRNWMIGPGGNTLTYWWVWLPATLVLILYGVGWNLLGDGLNDALNPRV